MSRSIRGAAFGLLPIGILLGSGLDDLAEEKKEPVVECPAEDLIPVATLEEAYDYPTGTQACVHVDVFIDQVDQP